MAVTVRILDPGAARSTISRAVAREVRVKMNDVGRMMVQDANMLMQGDFDTARPFERRRHPGSRHAINALDYSVEGGADLPLTLAYRVLGGDEVYKRILGMNFGTPAHRIHGGSGAWSLKGKTNVNRMGGSRPTGTSRSKRRPDLTAWVDGDDVLTPESDHPGTAGSGFLEMAFELAMMRLSS